MNSKIRHLNPIHYEQFHCISILSSEYDGYRLGWGDFPDLWLTVWARVCTKIRWFHAFIANTAHQPTKIKLKFRIILCLFNYKVMLELRNNCYMFPVWLLTMQKNKQKRAILHHFLHLSELNQTHFDSQKLQKLLLDEYLWNLFM